MNESMYKYMKIGLIHFMAFPSTIKGEGPILETLKKIVLDNYFNAVEVTWIKDSETRKKVKEMLAVSHMKVTYGAQPRLLDTDLNINDLNEERRLKAVASLKEGIDEAEYMGAKEFNFLSEKYEEATKEESFKALVKSTKELYEYAKGKEIKLVLEIFDYDADKKSLIGTVDLALRYAKEIRKENDNFGFIVNLSHLPFIRGNAEKSLLPIKDYIVHAHIGKAVCKDPSMTAYEDAHSRFGFPKGENDVEELVECLKILMEMDFLDTENPPIVSFGVKPRGDEDSEIMIANTKRVLNEAWARFELNESKFLDRFLWLWC